MSATGRIKAVDVDISFDTGAYVESQMIVLTLTSSYIHSLYKIEAARYSGRLVSRGYRIADVLCDTQTDIVQMFDVVVTSAGGSSSIRCGDLLLTKEQILARMPHNLQTLEHLLAQNRRDFSLLIRKSTTREQRREIRETCPPPAHIDYRSHNEA